MKPVIIDMASGVYEALALAVAAKLQLQIKAITVNSVFESSNKSQTDIMGLCKDLRIDAPVLMGAQQPIIATGKAPRDRYPRLPETMFEKVTIRANNNYAWDAIYAIALEAQGELTIICLGPLTNLAIALFKYPELPNLVKEVIFYGGTLDWGNAGQTSEINMMADPHAADAISKSGMNITMVPWSQTRESSIPSSDVFSNEVLENRLLGLLENREKSPLEETYALNHIFAVWYAADRSAFLCKNHIIRIETESNMCKGRTCPNLMYSLKTDPPNMNVVRDIDVNLFTEQIKSGFCLKNN